MKRLKSNDKQMTHIRALLDGDSGIGKTTSILTLPADKTDVACAERGMLPLRRAAYNVAVLETFEDCRQLIRDYRTPDESGPKVLVIDSLTECSEFCKSEIIQVDRKALIVERSQGKSNKPVGVYDDLMTMEDWNLYSARMNGFLGAACRLPMHVIFTALAMRKENKKTGEQLVVPDVNGMLAFECASYFDLVMHMENMEIIDGETKKQTRVWRTANNGEIIAKDASGVLAQFEPANWGHIFKKILGNGGAKPKAAKKAVEPKQEEVAV